ncbi:phospholipase D family protein [Pontibacter sp. HSC-36F09]|uniref:phospholipase D family protein n=1 Tax=Pontibacter sp. HSC-36F09 TaxID=2910966 RepID=UPI00209CA693|nr:phospholipase D family protein [Pontibacter sp. HSC-36F09]MCP2045052.1 hypothetical protein [Pontibacter sp. HSC-36F09]
MAKFLRTAGISYKIEDIIVNAKEELVIVSPYLKISNNLFERLKEKSDDGVRIDFVYGKSELLPVERRKIEGLRTINLYFHENLHAKCYYNEQEMIITSMNLYEFSEKNNREMGVFISRADDLQLYEDGVQEAKSIIAASRGKITGHGKVEHKQTVITSSVGPNATVGSGEFNHKSVITDLTNELNRLYSAQDFQVNKDNLGLVCQEFISKNIKLEIIVTNSAWRINVQLVYDDFKERRKVYDMLSEDFRHRVESSLPKGTVSWGSQMKRVKIGITKWKHLDYFTTNEDAITKIAGCIKQIEDTVIPAINKINDVFRMITATTEEDMS